MATRYPEAIPLKKVDTASTAQALLQVFSAYGVPSTIVHENFTSQLMKDILKSLSISQIRVAPYHPEANGMIERLNGTLKHAIMKAGATRSTWDKWLHFVLHAVKVTDHSATGHTPYELLFGRKPVTPISSLRASLEDPPVDRPQTVTDYLTNLHHVMSTAKAAAEETEAKAKADAKAYYDSKHKTKESELQPGSTVMCYEPVQQKGLSAAWLGPFTIQKRLGKLTYLIDVGHGKTLKLHRNAIIPYQPDTLRANPVVMALADEEAEDGVTLGPTAQTPSQMNLHKDVKGIAGLPQQQQQELHSLITKYSSIFADTPPQADLPAFHLDTGHTAPIARKPYCPAMHWKERTDSEVT